LCEHTRIIDQQDRAKAEPPEESLAMKALALVLELEVVSDGGTHRALRRQSWQHDRMRGFPLQHCAQVLHGNNAELMLVLGHYAAFRMVSAKSSDLSYDCRVNRRRAVGEATVLFCAVPFWAD